MKTNSFTAILMIILVSIFCAPSFAQSGDRAASKEKQANLEKIKAHQAELRKKYDAMTPEQKAEAKKKATTYKRGGYKAQQGKAEKAATTAVETPQEMKPSKTAIQNKKSARPKPPGQKVQKATDAKPIFLDANGKPLNKTNPTTPAAPKSVAPAAKATTAKVKATTEPAKK